LNPTILLEPNGTPAYLPSLSRMGEEKLNPIFPLKPNNPIALLSHQKIGDHQEGEKK